MNERSIFEAAIEKDSPEERAAFLNTACGQDAKLRDRLDLLLREFNVPDPFLDAPPSELARTISTLDVTETVGSIIGPYKIREQIGEGGMGVVYVAQQEKPVRRKVALKIIKPGMDTKEVIARFEAERQALALMDHPNIAKVLDVGTTGKDDTSRGASAPGLIHPSAPGESHPAAYAARLDDTTGRPYFAMELVRGVPITEYCDKKRLNTRERLELFIQVCRAIQHAHQKGIIHRDLKPTNILVTLVDAAPVPKVIDFGVAKAVNQQLTDHSVYTAHSQMIGTPMYMSPEQAEMTNQDVDTRSDVYSLGVLLYELLTGSTPLDKQMLKEAGFDEMRRIIREEEPPRPSTRISTLHAEARSTLSAQRSVETHKFSRQVQGELDWIVMQALDKDRTRRYESASAFAADVERYLKNEPVEACPPSSAYRLRKFARRNKTIITTTGLVAASLIIGIFVSVWQAVEAKDAFFEADKQREIAVSAAKLAQQNEEFSLQLVYAADVKMAAQAWKSGDVRRFTDLLDRHSQIAGTTDRRGFEWWYLRQFGTANFHNIATETGGTCAVRYSPDGKYLVAGQHDGTVCIWDGHSFEHLASLRGHEFLVRGIDFAPDGIRMASIGDDGMIRVWNLSEQKLIRSIKAHSGHGFRVFFVMDGTVLASSGEDTSVRLWDPSTGEALGELEGYARTNERAAMDRSLDGKLCASGNPEGYAYVWDVETHKRLCKLDLGAHEGTHCWASCLCFSPDGRFVAIGTDQNIIRLCDARTGKQIETFTGHEDDIQAVAFHPSGSLLASSDMAGVIRLWPINSPSESNENDFGSTDKWPPYFQGHSARAWSLDFSPDGTRLVSASKDGTVRSWSGRKQIRRDIKDTAEANSTTFASHGSELLIAGDKSIRIWNRDTDEIRPFGESFNEGALCVAISPDGATCVTGHDEGIIRFWSRETGRLKETLAGHEDDVNQIAFSPDGRLLVSGSSDGTAKLWDMASRKQLANIDMPKSFNNLAFSPDAKLLACSSGDDTVIFEIASRKRLRRFQGNQYAAHCVAFSSDGQLLATGNIDRTIRIWDVETGEVKQMISAHKDGIDSLAFSPDGRTIASGDGTGTIAFSHVETGQFLFDIKVGNRKVRCLQFSPDGEILAATVNYQGVILLHAPRIQTNDLAQPVPSQPFLEIPRKIAGIESTPAVDLPLASNTNDPRAEFFGLGLLPDGFSDSYAVYISTDGSAVIGYCQRGKKNRHYFVWKQDTGLRELAGQQGYVSGLDDGGRILYGASSWSGIKRATIWSSPSEFRFLPQPPEQFRCSECEAASADGSILVGWYKNPSNRRHALRWTTQGVEVLSSTTPGVDAMANTISTSGDIIVGMESIGSPDFSSTETRIWPVRWTAAGVERLPGFDPAYNWFVNDISSDGSVVVGMRWPAGSNGPWSGSTALVAFLWKNGTITLLGDRPGSNISSRASSISDDGRVVVGVVGIREKSFAFVWDSANGLRPLESVLRRYDVIPLTWQIHDAKSVSGDGLTIVGWGLRKNGHKEAWLARLPKQAFAPP